MSSTELGIVPSHNLSNPEVTSYPYIRESRTSETQSN
jgi:hypothetical protein